MVEVADREVTDDYLDGDQSMEMILVVPRRGGVVDEESWLEKEKEVRGRLRSVWSPISEKPLFGRKGT